MKRTRTLACLALFCSISFIACKKTVDKQETTAVQKVSSYEDPLIAEARLFFQKEVAAKTNTLSRNATMRQKLKKTPLWEKSYIALHEEGDVVTVPLDYQGGLSYTTSFGDNKKRSVQGQAKLLLYKGKDGGWKAEVATYISDQIYSKGKSATFSGVVLVEDWAGRTINNFLFKEGKSYRFKNTTAKSVEPGGEVQTATGNCYIINWYLCTVDEDGNTLGCEYQYSERVGCDVSGDDPNGGDGASGGSEVYNEYEMAVTEMWTVYSFDVGGGQVYSTERLKGKRVASEFQGGHFTGGRHISDECNRWGGLWTSSYTDFNYGTTAATMRIRGTWVEGDTRRTIENVKAWSFSEVF
ncbi:hypothetical protein [Flavisolibacter tropicus]|uniref:DUF4440 domain-containing protein n=1 Tax=Flavisolibacter tropicus TaxID=1492898 RepID=A0A172TY14_9BACT|nr:hypothetical protein [Flavisolibacter tropicus]ANE51858.1 hypothetical protein SY85_16530 [Flavisolibacter tropicus]